tara:strand:+ start:529 stop:960 length:432 start_codon:yes stop_codon:yes gene_type:complete
MADEKAIETRLDKRKVVKRTGGNPDREYYIDEDGKHRFLDTDEVFTPWKVSIIPNPESSKKWRQESDRRLQEMSHANLEKRHQETRDKEARYGGQIGTMSLPGSEQPMTISLHSENPFVRSRQMRESAAAKAFEGKGPSFKED